MGRKAADGSTTVIASAAPKPKSLTDQLKDKTRECEAYRDALLFILEGSAIMHEKARELVAPYLDWEIEE